MTDLLATKRASDQIPVAWRAEVETHLGAGETVISALEVDLDTRLHFANGLVVVTDRRILARNPGEVIWRDWHFHKDLHVQHHDHAGVGHLEGAQEVGHAQAPELW